MIKLKNNNGVTIVALSVTILIIIMISSTLIYNSHKGISTRTLNNMYNDIELLKHKVSTYYVKYGTLPVLQVAYTDISNIKNINVNDNDMYYVIDLSLLPNLTLNYGKGFNSVKETNLLNKDVYIINEQSHNIYYPAGINYDDIMYYTIKENYSEVEIND